MGHNKTHGLEHEDGSDPISNLPLDSTIFNKASGSGIKIDKDTPEFGWRDLIGEIKLHGVGANEPVYNVWKSGIRAYEFDTVNDEVFLEYHMPHDYAEGTDLYIHTHWSVDTAAVTGSVTWGLEFTYAKGHDQAAFGANRTTTIQQTVSPTAYQHLIAEVPMSASSTDTIYDSATLLDTDELQTDGLILVRCYLSANALSGGNNPFLHFVDIHYQSTNIPTKNRAPDFYA